MQRRVKIKIFLLGGPSQNPARSTLGTRVQHMSGCASKEAVGQSYSSALGSLNHAASPTCKAVFDFLGGEVMDIFCSKI